MRNYFFTSLTHMPDHRKLNNNDLILNNNNNNNNNNFNNNNTNLYSAVYTKNPTALYNI